MIKQQTTSVPEEPCQAALPVTTGPFDPNAPGNPAGGIYGLPFTPETARVVILPVPWEVTVSYRAGTARGPEAVWQASFQVDLYDEDIPDVWRTGIAMEPIPVAWKRRNAQLRKHAKQAIAWLEQGKNPEQHRQLAAALAMVNAGGADLNAWVKAQSLAHLDAGRLVAVLGGDHSSPLGLMQALAEKYDSYGILHIDAHADLREAFEGFEFSHASIMWNALKIPQVQQLVQVGLRDYCDAEAQLIHTSGGRVQAYTARAMARLRFGGTPWQHVCAELARNLPQKVYVSFDIDGLEPTLCPHTGTPVPGGLSFDEAWYLIEAVVRAGKTIIGLDLCEVAPGEADEWDGNVGARLLYRLCNLMASSHHTVHTVAPTA